MVRFSRRSALLMPLGALAAVALDRSALAALQTDATPVAAPSPQLPVTVTDVNGQSVTVTDVSRIIPLSGDVAEIVWALGFGPNIVAVDVSAVYPEALQALPKVGFERNLSAEGILAMTPTVVIGKEQAGPPPVLEQVKGAGVPVVIIAEPQTLEAPTTKINAIAAALGVAADGAALADTVQAEIDAATALAATATSQPKVLLVYLRGEGTQLIGGAGTVSQAMIEGAGGIDAGAATGIQGFAPLSAEALVAAAPDLIVTPSSGLESIGGIEGMLQIPGIAETPAGQNGGILAFDDELLLGMTPRTGQALMQMVLAFHPELATASPVASPVA